MAREKWDAADAHAEPDEDDPMEILVQTPKSVGRSILPDWTRSPLPQGAPAARIAPLAQPPLNVVVSSPPQTVVGA